MRKNVFYTWKAYLFILSAFFLTQSANAQLLNEGFDGATFPPAGWASFDNGIGTASSWYQRTLNTYSGAGVAYVQYETIGSTSEDWLVSPAFTPTASEYQLSFYQRQTYTGFYGSTYQIRVSTTSQTNAASFTTVASYSESSFGTTYSQKIIDLSAYVGQPIYVAFVLVQDDGDDWHVDNVMTFVPCNLSSSTTISSVTNVCSGIAFDLSLSATYSGVTYQWQSSPDGTNWTDIAGAQASTYSATQSSATYYQCVISCPASGPNTVSSAVMVSMASLASCYCVPSYSNSSCNTLDFIDGVELNTISNTGTGCAISGTNFSDYTSISTTLTPGNGYPIIITPCPNYAQAATVWIDFDQNGTFDVAEQVFFHTATLSPMSGTLTIPPTAMPGTTRMRVRCAYAQTAALDPCNNYNYGETDDYTVVIGGSSCMLSSSTTTSSVTNVCSGVTFDLSLSATYSGVTYQWQSSPDGNNWADIMGAQTATYTATQSSATYYQCVITCNSSTQTITSMPVMVNMCSVNFDCFTNNTSQPAAPSLTLGTNAYSQINSTWTSSNAPNGYMVQWRVMGSTTGAMSQQNTPNTSYTISTLQPGTTYEVRVMSRCSNLTAPFVYSPWASLTTQAMPGCGSAVISCGTSTNNSISIDWAAQTNAIGYRIRYQRVGFATYSNITAPMGSLTSYNIPGLLPNTTYNIWILTQCVNGLFYQSNTIQCTTSGMASLIAPDMPLNFAYNGIEYVNMRADEVRIAELDALNGDYEVDFSNGTPAIKPLVTGTQIGFGIVPNPTTNRFEVILAPSADATAEIILTDLSGQVIMTQATTINENGAVVSFDTQDLTTGVYLVTVTSATQATTQKLVVLK